MAVSVGADRHQAGKPWASIKADSQLKEGSGGDRELSPGKVALIG